jgi:hypothetical protein
MSSPPRPIKKSPKQSPGSGHRGLPNTPKTPRQVYYTQTPNLGTSAIYRNDLSIIIEKYLEIQKMLEDYKKKLEKYKTNPEDVDYDSLLRDCNSIKAEIKKFDTTYREEYESMRNAVLDLKEDEAKRERARINEVDFPYTKRELPPLEKFKDPEEPEEPEEPKKRGFFEEIIRGCCSCRKNKNKFKSKSKSKKGKKSSKKGKKSKKTQKSK